MTHETHDSCGERSSDALVARVAALQHGQIAVAQLRACGLTSRQIEWRVRTGRLHHGPRGVYSVGIPARTDHARASAATLAVEGAVLGVRSASNLSAIWTNVRTREVVFAPRKARPRDDLDVRHGCLHPSDVTRLDGIPITTAARTLLDLAAELSERPLLDALATARVRRLVTDDGLRAVLARHPRHRGTGRLGRALTGPFTRSRLERVFGSLLAGLPPALVNHRIGADECDAVWPEARLVVEVDGPHHAGEWAADAARDERLRAAGWTVLRLTAWDVERDGARTRARVLGGLGR